MDVEILSGVGEDSCLKMRLEFLSCVQTASLSACYDNIILKAKQIICLESLYLKKDLLAFLPTGYKKSRSICSCKIRKFAYSAPAVHEKEKILQCSKVICHFGKFIGWCSVLSLAVCNIIFFGCC